MCILFQPTYSHWFLSSSARSVFLYSYCWSTAADSELDTKRDKINYDIPSPTLKILVEGCSTKSKTAFFVVISWMSWAPMTVRVCKVAHYREVQRYSSSQIYSSEKPCKYTEKYTLWQGLPVEQTNLYHVCPSWLQWQIACIMSLDYADNDYTEHVLHTSLPQLHPGLIACCSLGKVKLNKYVISS